MAPLTLGHVVVLAVVIVLVLVVILWLRRARQCSTSSDCKNSDVCAAGKCVPTPVVAVPSEQPSQRPVERPIEPPRTPVVTPLVTPPGWGPCPRDPAKLGVVLRANNDSPPFACGMSKDGKWMLFPSAWGTTFQGGAPQKTLTAAHSSLEKCQASCDEAPTCQSWAFKGDGNCYNFSTAAEAIYPSGEWTLGVKPR